MADLELVDEDGAHLREIATWGPAKRAIPSEECVWRMDCDYRNVVATREGSIDHTPDLKLTERYLSGDPMTVAAVDVEKLRTMLVVPLLKTGTGMGCLVLFRQEQKPFTDDEIALVETFAAQAVIAIENVRQFKALEARTQEVQRLNSGLESRVEAQVGEIERMGRLKRFLSPQVADAVLSSGNEKLLSSHRALLGILFCDIRGFTAFCVDSRARGINRSSADLSRRDGRVNCRTRRRCGYTRGRQHHGSVQRSVAL